jgi:uncharacterized metal-binding protein YceD (DUF177 family)
MVSFNVSQLLLEGPGATRTVDFREPLPDPSNELHLKGPISGRARLIRTSEGILAHSDFHGRVVLECSRCLEETTARVDGELDEEFLPTTDIRSGTPVHLPDGAEDDQPLINDHHEIDLNEILRQNILTSLPLQPLCEETCPGLCPTCGERLGPAHAAHPTTEETPVETPVDPSNPFARLAVLLHNDEESA